MSEDMSPTDKLALQAFGRTRQEAWRQGICINCGNNWKKRTHSEEGVREWEISALCEECFDSTLSGGQGS